MKAGLLRLALIGIILGIAWWLRDGFGDVQGALDVAGWTGVAILAAYHMVPLAMCGFGWSVLQDGLPVRVFIIGRWIKDGVGELAGFLPLSGEVVSIRLLTMRGVRTAESSAIVVADVTSEAIAQAIFSLVGVALWMRNYPESDVTRWALIAMALSVPGLAAFVALQRSVVMRFLETLPSRLMPKTWDAPDADAGVQAAIHAIYSDPKRVGLSLFWHVAAWVAGAGEAWVALHLLGHPLGLDDVLAMESVIFAIRSIAFVVPAAIGLQEGGYLIVGVLLGLSPEVALALSLLKRGRELMLGLPALLAWHFVEGAAGKARQAASE